MVHLDQLVDIKLLPIHTLTAELTQLIDQKGVDNILSPYPLPMPSELAINPAGGLDFRL